MRTSALVCALAAPGIALGATVQVTPSDDIASLTASLAPGTEVVFGEGLYLIDTTLDWSHVGTESDPIILRASEGAVPVIDLGEGGSIITMVGARHVEIRGLTLQGSGIWESSSFDGFYIADSENVTVEDCVLRNLGDEGFDLEGVNVGLVIRGNEITLSSGGSGIVAGCDDASCWTQDSVIEGNWIHDMLPDGAFGIYLANGCTNNTVVDNVMHGITYAGIGAGSTEFGDPNIIERNVVWNVGTEENAGIGMYLWGTAIVRNNLVFNTFGYGIYTGSASTLSELVLSFNTVVETTNYGLYINEPWAGLPGMVLANNVVANTTGYAARVPDEGLDTQNRVVGNLFTGLVDGLDEELGHFGPGGGVGDFEDAEGWNFYPTDSSLLRDAADPDGSSWVPAEDFNGLPRDGAFPDVGAYEYQGGGGNPGWVVQEGFKELADGTGASVGDVGGGCCGKDKSDPAEALLLFPLVFLAARRRRQA